MNSNVPWGVDPGRIDRNWQAIVIELDAPRVGRLERLLRRLGLPAHVTRLMAATPTLRRSWFVALGLVVVIGLGATDATRPREDLFTLLLLAPLVPVLGISLAYGVEADPSHEAALATPMSGLRLLLTRTVAILGCSIAVLGLTSLLTPSTSTMAFAWILPAFGLSAVSLALMTFTSPRVSAGITATCWTVGVTLVSIGSPDRLAPFGAGGQFLMSTAAAVGLGVAYWRRERFDVLAVA